MLVIGQQEENTTQRRNFFRAMADFGIGPVTLLLILVCAATFIEQYFKGPRFLENFYISGVDIADAGSITVWRGFLERLSSFHQILPEIKQGQVWRLFTPLFVHLTFTHIFFNLVCLRDLGSVIEARLHSFWLLILVLFMAPVSNLALYLIIGASAGGMSCLVYALAAYVWVRGKFNPESRLYLNPITLGILLIWALACLVGILGPILNTAHAIGLVMGTAWGALSSLLHRWKRA